jgi:LemA protein
MLNLVLVSGLIAVVVVLVTMAYNKLVAAKNRFRNAYSQIDVQLQRRYDLIPNLVETARGYMAHEKDTLTNVINARNQASSAARAAKAESGDADNITRLAQAEGVLGGALGRLFAVAENYPDLKANATMQQLMEELSSTENRVSFARQAFNDAVMEYNIVRERFPTALIAGPFGFATAQQLDISNVEARQPMRVSFQ